MSYEVRYYDFHDGHISSALVVVPDDKADETVKSFDDWDIDPEHIYFSRKVEESAASPQEG